MKHKTKSILYSLIQSLKESDFIKFKQFIINDDLKIKLLDIYRHSEEDISDKVVIKSLDKIISEKDYIDLKNSIEDTLLEYLNTNYYPGDTKKKLQKELTLAHTLCKLGYVKKGLDRIKKITETAKSYNLFITVALALDYTLELAHEYRSNPEKARQISEEINENFELKNNYMQYKLLSLQIYSYQNVLNVDEKIINNFLNNPLLKDNTKPKSIIACFFYYMALMDLHDIAKNYKERLKVANNAVAYFKGILKTNDFYFPKYYYLIERKAYSELLINDFNELKKTLDSLDQLIVPQYLSNNLAFQYKLEVFKAKYSLSYYLEKDENKAYELLQTKFIDFLNSKQSTLNDLQSFYYNIFLNYIVKFQKNQDVIGLSPLFFKFFKKNITLLNPKHTFVMQTFICIFFSAYLTMDKKEFKYFFETNLFLNNKGVFETPNSNYYFVYKMYILMLEVFDLGTFYNKKTLFDYLDLWSQLPDIKNKALYIAHHALTKEFDNVKNEIWMKRYLTSQI